jgi:hypothetical protein
LTVSINHPHTPLTEEGQGRRQLRLLSLVKCAMLILLLVHDMSADAKTRGRRRAKVKNLPSITVISSGAWNVAEELNVAREFGGSNTTVDYGFASGWNVGFSLLNAGLYTSPGIPLWDPNVLLNLEKNFHLSDNWDVVIGTQIGNSPWDDDISSRIEHYTYIDTQGNLPRGWGKFHAGVYTANNAMSGNGNVVGYLAGLLLPVNSTTQLILDYVSGRSGLSTATVQLRWALGVHWQVGAGVQLPAPNSGNPVSGLLGVYWQ